MYVFDYSDDTVKAQREASTCPTPATFDLGRSFWIFQPRWIFVSFFKYDHQHVCLRAHCPENGRQYMFLLSLHSTSVSDRQKTNSQKLWTTSSGPKFSQSSSQKVNIPMKQKFSIALPFFASGSSTGKPCVCCLSSFSNWIRRYYIGVTTSLF